MEKIAKEQIRKMASIFKMKPALSELFVNNRAEFQFVQDKQFSTAVTREQVEEAMANMAEDPTPDNISSLPVGSQELATELVEVKNQLADEKKNHDATTAELEALKAAAGETESLKAENDTLKGVAEAQETEIAKYKAIVEGYKAKVAELEKKLSKSK